MELDRAQHDVVGGRPGRSVGKRAAQELLGRASAAMYWAFIQRASRDRTPTATRRRCRARTPSPSARGSGSRGRRPGAQPSSARKLKSASGRIPSSRHSSTAAAPWRFDSFLRSVPRIMPRCANFGIGAPSARKSATCLGVLARWSSPRITCVIRMSASSTQTQKWYSGWPSDRTRTKSSSASAGNSTRPRIRSSTTIVSSGIRRRTTWRSPARARRSLSSSGIARPAPE